MKIFTRLFFIQISIFWPNVYSRRYIRWQIFLMELQIARFRLELFSVLSFDNCCTFCSWGSITRENECHHIVKLHRYQRVIEQLLRNDDSFQKESLFESNQIKVSKLDISGNLSFFNMKHLYRYLYFIGSKIFFPTF